MQIQTRHNQLVAHPDTSKVHVKVAIPYTTHNDCGFATAFLEPEQACELAEKLVEYAAEVKGTDRSGSPRRTPEEPNNMVDLGKLRDVRLCAVFKDGGTAFYGLDDDGAYTDLTDTSRKEAAKRLYAYVSLEGGAA